MDHVKENLFACKHVLRAFQAFLEPSTALHGSSTFRYCIFSIKNFIPSSWNTVLLPTTTTTATTTMKSDNDKRRVRCNGPCQQPETCTSTKFSSTHHLKKILATKKTQAPPKLRDARWNKKFLELTDYKRAHGDCLVPKNYPPNPALSRWVVAQRFKRNRGSLDDERAGQLDSLGFEWSGLVQNKGKAYWEERFQELLEYKQFFGDCLVPRNFPVLGPWVNTQRYTMKKGNLLEERFQKLNSIGFEWSVMKNRMSRDCWKMVFQRYVEFKQDTPKQQQQQPQPPTLLQKRQGVHGSQPCLEVLVNEIQTERPFGKEGSCQSEACTSEKRQFQKLEKLASVVQEAIQKYQMNQAF